jgi:hypothetical protein
MIPVLILLGLVLGRRWWLSLVVAAVGWPVLLVATDTATASALPVASLLAVLNAGVGVLVHQAVLRAVRRVRGVDRLSGRG